MKSDAGKRRSRRSMALGLELLEITSITHRHDDTLRRDDEPAAILALDLLDRSKPRQCRTQHNLIEGAMTLNIDEPVACFADGPIGDDCGTMKRFSGRRRPRCRQRC